MTKLSNLDDLIQYDKSTIKMLLRNVELNKIAIAMHGLSPELKNKIKHSLTIKSRIKLIFSPISYTSIKLSLVENVHKEILNKINAII